MKEMIITIDGPAGAGKSTVSRMLAQRLGYRYIDTGALYRGIAFKADKDGVSADDDKGLEKLCLDIKLEFSAIKEDSMLILDKEDITDKIRTSKITMLSSSISAKPVVRSCLLNIQREMGIDKNAVFEGRDMGTVVFPEADIKFFLDASVKQRALRRYLQYKENGGDPLEKIEKNIIARDLADTNRKNAPLKMAEDAFFIDSTNRLPDKIVEIMISHIKSKGAL